MTHPLREIQEVFQPAPGEIERREHRRTPLLDERSPHRARLRALCAFLLAHNPQHVSTLLAICTLLCGCLMASPLYHLYSPPPPLWYHGVDNVPELLATALLCMTAVLLLHAAFYAEPPVRCWIAKFTVGAWTSCTVGVLLTGRFTFASILFPFLTLCAFILAARICLPERVTEHETSHTSPLS